MRGGGVFTVRRRAPVPGAGEAGPAGAGELGAGLRGGVAAELTAALTGIRLGLNVFNALFIGVLGVPGFGLLLLLQWVLT